MKLPKGHYDVMMTILLAICVMLFFIWRPVVMSLYDIYNIDPVIDNFIFWKSFDQSMYLFGFVLIIFILYRYKNFERLQLHLRQPKTFLDSKILRYKRLSIGMQRLLIILYAIWWVWWLSIDEPMNGTAFFLLSFTYWVIVSIILWIYDGFNTSKTTHS